MKKSLYLLINIIVCILLYTACAKANSPKKEIMKYNQLTPQEEAVIIHKGTERPFTGEYITNSQSGTYTCKQCDAPLYHTHDQFDAGCGWPSFDSQIVGAVKRVPDADGRRTEIVCANCNGHLGHVFLGEGFTLKDTRHCVNSISMKFVVDKAVETKRAYFASGCFWGTEYYFSKAKGVTHSAVGFMDGHVDAPTYRQVCQQNTGHIEVTEVDYSNDTNYAKLVKLFFETHDFTQTNGQGPDIGPQYLSCIFYSNDSEKTIAHKYIKILEDKGYKVATMLKPASTFWIAEDYHQQYYDHKGSTPYCHIYKEIFD